MVKNKNISKHIHIYSNKNVEYVGIRCKLLLREKKKKKKLYSSEDEDRSKSVINGGGGS